MELQTSSFPEGRVIPLLGEWEFYWKKLYTPQELPPIVTGYAELPGLWNDLPQAAGQEPRGNGYATYRLTVNLPQAGTYGIKIREFNNAYRLWANGKLLGAVGNPATSREADEPSWRREEFYFDSGPQLELVMQVSSWDHRKGGPEEQVFLGRRDDIRRLKIILLIIDLCIGGAAVVIGLYHLLLYLQSRKDSHYLVFFILCILVLVRSFFCGEKIILNIFPDFPWYLSMQIDYISAYFILPVIIALLGRMFPALDIPVLKFAYLSFASLLALVMVFASPWTASFTMKWFQVVAFACMIHGTCLLVVASWRRYPQGLTMLIGFLILCMTAMADILFMNRLFVFPAHILHVGFFIMLIFEAACLATRFSKAMVSNEHNLERLHKLNTSLTRFVPVEFMHYLEKEAFTETSAISHVDADLALVHLTLKPVPVSGKTVKMDTGLVDRYLERILPQTSDMGGFVESIQGSDLVLVFPAQARRAITASLALYRELDAMQQDRRGGIDAEGNAALIMYAGIHWGSLDTTEKYRGGKAITSDSNLIATTLRDVAQLFGSSILVSQDVCRQLGALDEWNLRFLCRLKIKTRLIPVPVYELFTCLSPESRALTLSTRELFEVAVQDFWRGQREEALVSFEHVLHIHPEDRVAAKYCEWIRYPELFARENGVFAR